MKTLKKNELRDLLKLGRKAVLGKIAELKASSLDLKLKTARGEEKNLRARKNLRRTIAQLMTNLPLLKEVK